MIHKNKCTAIENTYANYAANYYYTNYRYTVDSTLPVWENKRKCFADMKLHTYYDSSNTTTKGYHNLTTHEKPL